MNKNISKKELRNFSLIIAILFTLLFGIFFPYFHGVSIRFWPFIISFLFLIIGISNPNLMKKIYFIWMKIGEILGWFNSKIILSIVFTFVLIPIAILMRLVKYDPLSLKRKNLHSYKIYAKEYIVDFTKIF